MTTSRADADPGGPTTPLLSTTDRGARMTQLPPGQPIGRVSSGLVVGVVAAVVMWSLVSSVPYAALLGLAPTRSSSNALGSPWALGAAIVLAYVAVLVTQGVCAQAYATFGQRRVRGLLAVLMVIGGGSVGGIVWSVVSYGYAPTPSFELDRIATSATIPRELGVLLGAAATAWALVTMCRLVLAVRHARSRQQMIHDLRRAGVRHRGVILAVDFRNLWVRDQPVFRIQVSYAARGEDRNVRVHMRTDPERVPVVGSPMVVLTDDSGSVHVELDLEVGARFEEDYRRFVPPEG